MYYGSFIPICPALCFRAIRYDPIEAERSISMYKSRGWSCSGVTVTENVCGSPGMEKWNVKQLTYYCFLNLPYSQKYWQELSLVVEANIVAIATVLVDLNLAIRYGILIHASKKYWENLIWRLHRQLDHQTAKFNSLPNFPAICMVLYSPTRRRSSIFVTLIGLVELSDSCNYWKLYN